MNTARIEARAGLAGLARGGASTPVPLTHPRSVKDAVESIGIPHTEVAAVVVDGRPAGLDDLLATGQVVVVHDCLDPPPDLDRPVQPPVPVDPTFAADVHLGTLARRLRVLGFDTWYETAVDDARLAELAVEQGRVLLSRDRGLLCRRIVRHGALVRADDPDRQVDEVVARFALSGRVRPGIRCPRCNGATEQVPRDQVLGRLEPGTRAAGHQVFRRCRDCDQLYWPGAHAADLDSIVERASRGGPPTS